MVLVEEQENPKGLVFVMHGLGGSKDQPHIKTFGNAFAEKGYTVVRFDTTNTLGESDGDLADATLTNYYEDLEDVIRWAESEKFFKEPFILCGHSLGSISIILFAEKYPDRVKAIAPTSTVMSGKLIEETSVFKEIGKDWEEKGIREWASKNRPGVIKRLKWSYVEDVRKYDVLPDADKLTMPVILIVGDIDDTTPLNQQEMLFAVLPGEKELHIIKGAEHTFRKEEHLAEIKQILVNWIEKVGD